MPVEGFGDAGWHRIRALTESFVRVVTQGVRTALSARAIVVISVNRIINAQKCVRAVDGTAVIWRIYTYHSQSSTRF